MTPGPLERWVDTMVTYTASMEANAPILEKMAADDTMFSPADLLTAMGVTGREPTLAQAVTRCIAAYERQAELLRKLRAKVTRQHAYFTGLSDGAASP